MYEYVNEMWIQIIKSTMDHTYSEETLDDHLILI